MLEAPIFCELRTTLRQGLKSGKGRGGGRGVKYFAPFIDVAHADKLAPIYQPTYLTVGNTQARMQASLDGGKFPPC